MALVLPQKPGTQQTRTPAMKAAEASGGIMLLRNPLLNLASTVQVLAWQCLICYQKGVHCIASASVPNLAGHWPCFPWHRRAPASTMSSGVINGKCVDYLIKRQCHCVERTIPTKWV